MLQQFKYWILGFVLVAIIVTAGLFYNHQNATVTSVQEIESTLNNNITGHLRTEESHVISKKELVTGLIADTVKVQKKNTGKLKLDYVFLDNQGNRTEVEKDIESVQIQTSILNEDGKEVTKSVKRISLKSE